MTQKGYDRGVYLLMAATVGGLFLPKDWGVAAMTASICAAFLLVLGRPEGQ